MPASRSGLLSGGCLYSPPRYRYHNDTGRRTEGLRGSQAICQAADEGTDPRTAAIVDGGGQWAGSNFVCR